MRIDIWYSYIAIVNEQFWLFFFVFGLSRRSFKQLQDEQQRWKWPQRGGRAASVAEGQGRKKTMGKRLLQKFHGFRMFQTSISQLTQLAGDLKYVWSSKIDRKRVDDLLVTKNQPVIFTRKWGWTDVNLWCSIPISVDPEGIRRMILSGYPLFSDVRPWIGATNNPKNGIHKGTN